jgi:hypothetical protein
MTRGNDSAVATDELVTATSRVIPVTDGKLRVVYVAGSGHTGSTLLALLLDAHPRIVSVGETAVKPRIRRRGDAASQKCSCGATISQCLFWQRIFRRVEAQGYDLGPERWSNDYRSEHPLVHRLLTRESTHPIVRAVQGWSARHLPLHAARMRRADAINVAFIRAALETAGADVFCDTTKHTMRLSRLLEIEQLDLKVITLVRDVRGYAASAKRRGHAIEDAAATWLTDQEVISRITKRLPADRTFLLRYEDLCNATVATLSQLYRFCGVQDVAPVTAVTSTNHHVLGNSLRLHASIHVRLDESWRAKLSADEQTKILNVAGAMNRAMGYSYS